MSYSSVYTTVPGAIVARISGAIVTCCTFSNIPITTVPRLNHAQDGGLLLGQRPAPAVPLQATPSGEPPLFLYRLGMTLMSRHNIDFIAFDFTAEDLDGLASTIPSRSLVVIAWASSGSRSSSCPICSLERFKPMK